MDKGRDYVEIGICGHGYCSLKNITHTETDRILIVSAINTQKYIFCASPAFSHYSIKNITVARLMDGLGRSRMVLDGLGRSASGLVLFLIMIRIINS